MPGKVPTANVPLTSCSPVRALSPWLCSTCHRGSPSLQPQPGQGLAMLQGQELSRNASRALLQRQAPSEPRRGCVAEANAAVLVFVLPSDSAGPKRFPPRFVRAYAFIILRIKVGTWNVEPRGRRVLPPAAHGPLTSRSISRSSVPRDLRAPRLRWGELDKAPRPSSPGAHCLPPHGAPHAALVFPPVTYSQVCAPPGPSLSLFTALFFQKWEAGLAAERAAGVRSASGLRVHGGRCWGCGSEQSSRGLLDGDVWGPLPCHRQLLVKSVCFIFNLG